VHFLKPSGTSADDIRSHCDVFTRLECEAHSSNVHLFVLLIYLQFSLALYRVWFNVPCQPAKV